MDYALFGGFVLIGNVRRLMILRCIEETHEFTGGWKADYWIDFIRFEKNSVY